MAIALLMSSGLAAARADEFVWVNELEIKPELVGREVVVEGRFSGRVGANLDQIRLQNSKVEFQLPPDIVKSFPSGLRNVQLTGTLSESGGKLIMRVKSLEKSLSSEEDRYAELAARISSTDHKQWNELAVRFSRLADFYNEPKLKQLADSARVKGFRAEEASLDPSKANQLLQLADRTSSVGLNEDESRRMRHKALRWHFETLADAQTKPDSWLGLAREIEKHLPGANDPLRSGATTTKSYHEQPIQLYESRISDRDAFDRILWTDSMSRYFLAESDRPGANVFKLATEARQLIPENEPLARLLLEKWVTGEFAKLHTLSTSQVRKLAETLRSDLGQPERSAQVLRQWLASRSSKLGRRDADGRVQLARDYRSELGDDATAARLLLEAIEIAPGLPQAQDELKKLGYAKGPAGWAPTGNAATATPGTAQTARSGLPEVGMTSDQVRQRLGDPRSEHVVRIGTSKGVLEQWTYRGAVNVYLTFQRTDGQLRLISINTPLQ